MCLNNCKKAVIEDKYPHIEDWSVDGSYHPWKDQCDYIEQNDCKTIDKSINDLCVLQCNIRGAIGKQHELLDLIKNCTNMNCVEVVILVETWLTSESENRFNIPGYTYCGSNRKHKKGGGVGFLIKNNLNYMERLDLKLEHDYIENHFIEIKTTGASIVIGAMYRPPNTNKKEFLDFYIKCSDCLKQCKVKQFILGMDHNLDLLKHHSHRNTQLFLEGLLDYNHFPCITRPTRITTNSATLIDNLIVSADIFDRQNSCIMISDISDHLPCLLRLSSWFNGNSENRYVIKRSITEKKVKSIITDLKMIDWKTLLKNKNADESMNIFHDTYEGIMDEIAPEKLVHVSVTV